VFAVLLLAENSLTVYFFTADPMMSSWFKQGMVGPRGEALTLLRSLTTGALVFLGWVTWD